MTSQWMRCRLCNEMIVHETDSIKKKWKALCIHIWLVHPEEIESFKELCGGVKDET